MITTEVEATKFGGGRVWRRRGDIQPFSVIVGALALGFGFLIFYPLSRLFIRSFISDGTLDLSPFTNSLSNPVLPGVLWNTLVVVGSATLIAVAVATFLAWVNERTDARMNWAASIVPILPLVLPNVVLCIGWLFLAHERAGFLNGFLRWMMSLVGIERETGPFNIATMPSLIAVYVVSLVPFAYLVIAAALRNVDPALEEASRISGASIRRTFMRVTIGAIRPALLSASLLVVIMGLSIYSVPATIGVTARVDILAVHIVRSVQTFPPRTEEAVGLGVLLMVVLGSLWFVNRRFGSSQGHATISGRAQATVTDTGIWRWPLRLLVILYLTATSILPLGAVLLVSVQRFWSVNIDWSALTLDHYRSMLDGTTLARRSLTTSMTLGLIGATVGILIAAVLMIYVRQHQTKRAAMLDGVTKAPAPMSQIVIGVALILAFAGPPFNLAGTMTILLIAYLVSFMPQGAIAAESGLAQIPRELLEASSIAGASATRTLMRITLRLMLPALGAGWALMYVLMVGDLTVSSMLYTTNTPVVGAFILATWENGTFAPLAAVGSLIGLQASFMIGLVLMLSGRGSATGGRA